MNTNATTETSDHPSDRLAAADAASPPDPRAADGFIPHLFPTAGGADLPPAGGDERNDRIVLEFRAAYYDINLRWADLREVRAQPQAADFAHGEWAALQAIETALRQRDDLEDRYAPFGVIAEPKTQDGFTVDVQFSFGNRDARGRLRSDLYTITTYVPLPLPPGTKLDDLPCTIEGPGINDD